MMRYPDYETPRSPMSKEDERSSPPSTVPAVLSGTPGSPVPELPSHAEAEGLSAIAPASGLSVTSAAATPNQADWKFGADVERNRIGTSGAHADFVHVDEDELQDLCRNSATAPSAGIADANGRCVSPLRARCPLTLDSSNILPSEESPDGSSVSFNLSPMKRPGAGPTAADAARCCQIPSPCRSRAATQPARDPWVPSIAEDTRDNQENILPAGLSRGGGESKVAAMCSLWEQRSGPRARSSSATASVVVGRGRSASREACGRTTPVEEQRQRRARSHGSSLRDRLRQKMKKEEEATQKQTRQLDDVFRHFRSQKGLDGEVTSPLRDLDTSSCLSDIASECSQDSPTTKICRELSASHSRMARMQTKTADALLCLLATDAAQATHVVRSAPKEEVVPSMVLPGTHLPAVAAAQAQPPQCLQPLDLPPVGALGVDLCDPKKSATPPETPPAVPQPEEEADGPLLSSTPVENATTKSKILAAEEAAFGERAVVEGSRNSAVSDVSQPAREPQPSLESPRDPIAELSTSTDIPMLESPEGITKSSLAKPATSGPEHEEGLTTEASVSGAELEEPLTTEADSSMNSSCFGDPSASIDDAIDEALTDYSAIKPSENGMDHTQTLLYDMDQRELRREIQIIVPEGMGPDRTVKFLYEGKSHEVVVPPEFHPGAQMHVTLTNRPFLERHRSEAARRGRDNPNDFPDRWLFMDQLRHCSRTDCDGSKLTADEFRGRYHLYRLLMGKVGVPLLPFTPEEDLIDPTACS